METQKNKKRKSLFEPGVVISKKSYIFFIRKQFNDIKKYKASHPDELSLVNIKLILRHMFASKGDGKKKSLRPPVNTKALVFKIFTYIFMLSVILGLGFVTYTFLFPSVVTTIPPKPNNTMNYTYNIINTEVISFKSGLRAYATIHVNATNMNSTQIDMTLYDQDIPKNIVLLKSRRHKAERFDEFRDSLKKMFSDSGLKLTEIHISQLIHMSDVPMILIVPTGKIPSSFLGLDDPSFDIRNLLKNEDVIIYLGSEFDSGTIPENESEIILVDESIISKFEIYYMKINRPTLLDGFKMERPSYTIKNGKTYHGGISVLPMEKGFLVTFPSSLDDGWKISGEDAAHDIYSVIRNLTWLNPASWAQPYVFKNDEKEKQIESTFNIFSEPYTKTENLTAQFLFNTKGFDGDTITKIEYVDFPIIAKGTMDHLDTTLPTGLCIKRDDDGNEINCDLYMMIDLNENVQRTETMKLVAYMDGVKVSEEPIGKMSTQSKNEKLFYFVDIPSGDYVLKLEEDSGYVYAQSFLHVSDILVTSSALSWKNGRFTFDVYIDANQIGKNAKLDVRNVNISLDGRQQKTLESEDGKLTYEFSGSIAEGNHEFIISFGENTQTLQKKFIIKREWWDNPLYQVMFVLAAIIGAVGLIIKKPQSIILQLDVPDFPPLSKTKVPISPEQACGLFDMINTDYSWNYMPLRHGEIKNGFRKLSYKGRGILISDYNLEKILDQLIEKGLVQYSIGFYGLTEWEKRSKKPPPYLAVFRSLRNTFLDKSIHFTDFDKRKDCDILVSARERYYVHIYSGYETISKLFHTLQNGKTLLVFEDSESLDSFKRSLYSSDKALILLKIYIENGRLLACTHSEVKNVIK
ncbi:MAG: hypothetical protein ABIG39_02550 [Candidatus Micrarchaeota archaeon]